MGSQVRKWNGLSPVWINLGGISFDALDNSDGPHISRDIWEIPYLYWLVTSVKLVGDSIVRNSSVAFSSVGNFDVGNSKSSSFIVGNFTFNLKI